MERITACGDLINQTIQTTTEIKLLFVCSEEHMSTRKAKQGAKNKKQLPHYYIHRT